MPVRPALTADDWIQAGQRALVKGNVDAVRIAPLAKELKITRGSFYYHFKSRSELLGGIVSNWQISATEDLNQRLNQAQSSPQDQLKRLLELPQHSHTTQEAAAIELSIRTWARRDDQARQAIDEVDSFRLSYIESLLLRVGINPDEIKDRAYLIYAYRMSIALIQVEACPEEVQKRSNRMARLLFPQQESADA